MDYIYIFIGIYLYPRGRVQCPFLSFFSCSVRRRLFPTARRRFIRVIEIFCKIIFPRPPPSYSHLYCVIDRPAQCNIKRKTPYKPPPLRFYIIDYNIARTRSL